MRTANDFGGNIKGDEILRWPGTETREISGVTTFGSASDCRFVNAVSPRCSKGSDFRACKRPRDQLLGVKEGALSVAVDCAGAKTTKHPRDCRAWRASRGGQAGRQDDSTGFK